MAILKKLLTLLPKNTKHKILRKQVNLNAAYEANGITVKLATTKEELEAAYHLLHEAYVGIRIMDPHPSKIRVNIYSTLPFTSVIIAKKDSKVIGTVSLIKDSPIGLPSDSSYRTENDEHRIVGDKLVEVSALAVDYEYRKSQSGSTVSLLLMRYLYEYAIKFIDGDHLVCTIHPRSILFYEAFFNFKQEGQIIQYGFVKNALAAYLSLNLRTLPEWFKATTGQESRNKNFYRFWHLECLTNLIFPQRSTALSLDSVMTPELLEYFFMFKTNLLMELERDQLSLIKSAYSLNYPHHFEQWNLFRFIKDRRYFRYPTKIKASVNNENNFLIAEIFDLSVNGLYLKTNVSLPIGQEIHIQLILDQQPIPLKGKIVRSQSMTSKRLPSGYGVKLLQSSQKILELLDHAHHCYKEHSTKKESAIG